MRPFCIYLMILFWRNWNFFYDLYFIIFAIRVSFIHSWLRWYSFFMLVKITRDTLWPRQAFKEGFEGYFHRLVNTILQFFRLLWKCCKKNYSVKGEVIKIHQTRQEDKILFILNNFIILACRYSTYIRTISRQLKMFYGAFYCTF